MLFPMIAYSADSTQSSSLLLYDVCIDKDIFNPSVGENVNIRFGLQEKSKVSLKIFDFDQELITILCDDKLMEKGAHTFLWDGRDRRGKIVPDEAYFFIIETMQGADRAVYDPTTFSGGITHEIERINILPEQQLEYFLLEKGRVSIKAGIVNGPLLAIPLDWEPRPKGFHKEHWDGMDQDKLISLLKHPRYQVRASYFTLPENSILTTGNRAITYIQYKQMQDTPKTKSSLQLSKPKKSILSSPLYSTGVLFTKAPPIEIIFPQDQLDKNGLTVFKQKIPIKVDFPEEWKSFLSSKQYEIYFFMDYQFLTEEPWIRFPYETVLEVEKHAPGVHVLSVNIISPGGQVGVKSKKVMLE